MKTYIKFSIILLLLTVHFTLTPSVHAQNNGASDFEQLTNDQFDAFNPLKITDSPLADDLSTPGGILSQVLSFAFPIAGLILFVMIFWGGFEMLSGAATKKSIDAGKQRITAALVGFLLLFVSFWLIRVLEALFGIKVF